MDFNNIYKELSYTKLVDNKEISTNDEYIEFRKLGIDKIYFSDIYPAIFFKEVDAFDSDTLKHIAKIQHMAWNYRKVMFLFVMSSTEIRIYNCNAKPINYELKNVNFDIELEKFEIVREGIKQLKIIKEIFSRTAVDCGVLWITKNQLREKVDVKQRIDYFLVASLLNAAKELKRLGVSEEIIHSLLMRSIFIMYLEDKGAAKETNLYSEILPNANSFLDILKSKPATFKLFDKLQNHFNGNIFPVNKNEASKITIEHLTVIRKCLIDGDLSGNPKLFEDWKLFKFDVIQIELLSEIYENFLVEFKKNKKDKGQYYTPPSLVELVLNEKLNTKNNTKWNLKILDPSCGSGIFLVEAYKRLIKRWKNAFPGKQIEFRDLIKILSNNIYGVEVDKFSIRVTTFSLYLAIVEQLNPKTLWIDKSRKFPNLIKDHTDETIEMQGKNLLRCDAIGELERHDLPIMDLVIGNPPFGAYIKQVPIKKYCELNGFGQDMVIPFLHKAVSFIEKGEIALIFNTKVLTNNESPFQKFRQWLFNENYVEKIFNLSIFRKAPKSFGGQLFSSAVGPISILFYKKNKPVKANKTIEYWAPKTYVKNNLVDGVIIDSTDIKYLPREECCKPDTKIWKVAMWGSMEDYKFIEQLNGSETTLGDIIKKYKLSKGLGLQFLDNSTKKPLVDNEIPKIPYIKPSSIEKYYSNNNNFSHLVNGLSQKSIPLYQQYYNMNPTGKLKKINVFRRTGAKKAYLGPHLLIKEGLSKNRLCASFVLENCSFNSKVLGIAGNDKIILKSITAIFNSELALYYLFLISSSIGIEREEIKPNEIYDLPFKDSYSIFKKLSKYIDLIIKEADQHYPFAVDYHIIENKINEELIALYNITSRQQILISDFINYNVDLLFRGYKSNSLYPTSNAENLFYARTLYDELNNFLDSKLTISIFTYELGTYAPLNMISVKLNSKISKIDTEDNDSLNKQLQIINNFLLSKKSKGIYIKKQVKYFDNNDTIYLIKPNQRRFWNRSMALNDASELINEILKMS